MLVHQRVPWATPVEFASAKSGTEVPSGYVKIAIENDHRHSGFSHQKW